MTIFKCTVPLKISSPLQNCKVHIKSLAAKFKINFFDCREEFLILPESFISKDERRRDSCDMTALMSVRNWTSDAGECNWPVAARVCEEGLESIPTDTVNYHLNH